MARQQTIINDNNIGNIFYSLCVPKMNIKYTRHLWGKKK